MRIRTVLAACGLAAAVVTGTAGSAAAAPVQDHGHGTTTVNGNGEVQAYGNTITRGTQSPQIGLIQGSLNKPCIAVPVKANVGSLLGLIPITVQDVNLLSSPQNQQCTENSSQIKGDEPLSHLLSDNAVLSGNGNGNGNNHSNGHNNGHSKAGRG